MGAIPPRAHLKEARAHISWTRSPALINSTMNEVTQTGFRKEGEPAFPSTNTENGNSAASSPETPNATQTPSQGGEQSTANTQDGGAPKTEEVIDWSKFPDFTKHPRWQEREEDYKKRFNDQEKRHVDEIAKLREEFLGKGKQQQPQQGQEGASNLPDEVPAWFGGDQEQWNEFKSWNDKNLANARSAWETEQKQKSEAEANAIKEATDFMNSELTAIESDKELNPQGIKFDADTKNKLMHIADKFQLVDTQGRWNWRAAFAFYKNQLAQGTANTIQEKKDIAAATMTENKAEPQTPHYKTSADFSKPGERPW